MRASHPIASSCSTRHRHFWTSCGVRVLLDRLRPRQTPASGGDRERVDRHRDLPDAPDRARSTLGGRPGSRGLFTAILIAIVCVRVQKLFADANLVIRMPASVPPIVYQRSCRSRRFLPASSSSGSSASCWRRHRSRGANHVQSAGLGPQYAARYPDLRFPRDHAVVDRDQRRQRHRRHRRADLPAIFGRERRGDDPGAAAALCHRLWLLHDVRQRRRNGRHDRAGVDPVELDGPGFQERQPAVAADADLSDQRTDLFWAADRAESRLHDSVHSQRADPDDGQLPADVLERDPPAVRERPVDDAADHRALSGHRWRLAGGRLGRGLDCDRHGDLLSVCQGRRTAAGVKAGGQRVSTSQPFGSVSFCSQMAFLVKSITSVPDCRVDGSALPGGRRPVTTDRKRARFTPPTSSRG